MDPVLLTFLIGALVLSIVAHEAAHGYAADALGDPTARLQGRLTLNPLPHIDPLGSVLVPGLLVFTGAPFLFGWAKPVPYNPYNLKNQKWGEALVAAAGPATNLAIALFFGLLIRFGLAAEIGPIFEQLARITVYLNILLALFNSIPIPPLDGSKMLKALLPWRAALSYGKFESFMARNGFLGLILFLFLFVTLFSEPFFALIKLAMFLFTGSSQLV